MKYLTKIIGISIAVILYGLGKDFSLEDYAAWITVISCIAIPLFGCISSVVTVKAGRDERD
jgi:hypothetical protein